MEKYKKIIIFILILITILSIPIFSYAGTGFLQGFSDFWNGLVSGTGNFFQNTLQSSFNFITVGNSNSNNSFDDIQALDQTINAEKDNSLLEKMLASSLGHLVVSVLDIVQSAFGERSFSNLLYNDGNMPDAETPLQGSFTGMNNFYVIMTVIYCSLILISVVVFGIRYIMSGINPYKRHEVNNMLMRILTSMLIVMLTPIFLRVLLYINNLMVHTMVSMVGSSSVQNANQYFDIKHYITGNIQTGSALADVAILTVFGYIQIKINVLFIMRLFNIVVFYIFTPIASFMWSLDQNIEAFGIWIGELLSNIFMQFFYSLAFTVYIIFVNNLKDTSSASWLVPLIWAMILIPVANALTNSVQGFFARLSGVNEFEITNNGLRTFANMIMRLVHSSLQSARTAMDIMSSGGEK